MTRRRLTKLLTVAVATLILYLVPSSRRRRGSRNGFGANVFQSDLGIYDSELMKQPIINDVDYPVLFQPDQDCNGKMVDMVVCTISAVDSFDARRRMRRELDVYVLKFPYRLRRFFFLGTFPRRQSLVKRVKREAQTYGDMAQIDFIESPRNLSIKTMAVLKWVSDHCPKARFFLKTDDDVQLNLTRILSALKHRQALRNEHFVLGYSRLSVETPLRGKSSKYHVSREEYAPDVYPTFAHGPAYAMPMETAGLLYQVSLRTKMFWLEDVFITGMCTKKANVPVVFDNNFKNVHILAINGN